MCERNGRFVCESCIEEVELQKVVRDHAVPGECDYCKSSSEKPFVCDIDHVLQRILFAVRQEYTDVANKLPVNAADLGVPGVVSDTYDLFEQMKLYIENDSLREDIEREFGDQHLVSRDVLGPTTDEFFTSAWQRFTFAVQHQRRYTFWTLLDRQRQPNSFGEVAVGEMLGVIAQYIERVAPFVELPIGSELWRVQAFERTTSSTDPKRYTSPPIEEANQPNRMSPAGISMFYAAEEFRTSALECADPKTVGTQEFTGALFRTKIPLRLLDLNQFSKPASRFSALTAEQRTAVDFLTEFAFELSRPIKRDKRQHIQYVPTQVFTEFVRFELKTEEGDEIQGIKYSSSKDGKPCYVLFADQSDCLLTSSPSRQRPQMIEFVPGSLKTKFFRVRSKGGH